MLQTRIPAYKRVIPRTFLLVMAYVLVIGLVVGSFLPGYEKARLGTEPSGPTEHVVPVRHRIYHVVTFGSTALVMLLLVCGIRQEVTAAASVFAMGCLIEGMQHLVGLSAVFEWWDVRDDLYGVAGAFLLVQAANAVWRDGLRHVDF